MNLALPAIAIVLCLLPSIIFVKTYLSGPFPRRIANLPPLTELAIYVLLALPINAIALAGLHRMGAKIPLDLLVMGLTAGEVAATERPGIVSMVSNGTREIVICFLGTMCFAAISALVLRRIVWFFRLDVHIRILQMRNPWYYVLLGRLPGLPKGVVAMIDVMTEMPGSKCRLYRGVLVDFDASKDEALGRLTLKAPFRYSFGSEDGTKKRGWVEIPSENFHIIGRFIHSMNMQYYQIDPPALTGERLRWRLKRWCRMAILEE